jgi:hypothetical protein
LIIHIARARPHRHKLGALVDRADDVWKFKKLKPGNRDESKTFKLISPSCVRYVDVETVK